MKPSDVEIMSQTLMAVLAQQAEDRRAQQQMVQTLTEMHRDQMAVSQRLLDQYLVHEQNERSTLDQRLFVKEDEWEPMEHDPFAELRAE